MIERYTLPEMKKIWSLENKYSNWLEIENLACDKLEYLKIIPKSSAEKIRKSARFDEKKIAELEKKVKHDFLAFLTNISDNAGEYGKYIHYGLTSSDVVDTALSYNILQASKIIKKKIIALSALLKKKAAKYKYSPAIGRTHGIHAEPTTIGMKFALWHSINKRNLSRFEEAIKVISFGKISGAVGIYANIPPSVEKYVCAKLGLKPALVSTQILQRDSHSQFMTTIAVIGGTIEAIATEIRLLQQTEIGEFEEFFGDKQKGSSAMPHKRNPVNCENLCGLARVLRGYALTSLENIALWHERDISHSGAERIIIPDGLILLDFMLQRLTDILKNLTVNESVALENISKTNGLIFSGNVLLKMVESKKHSRTQAYEIIREIAMKCFKEKLDFEKRIMDDKRIMLTEKEISECFDLNNYFKQIDHIYKINKL